MIQVYRRQEHEWFLVHLWNLLLTSGDANRLFLLPIRGLTDFLSLFSDPATVLLFDSDKAGVWFAAWFRPLASGAEFSLWCRKDKRRSPTGLRHLNFCYEQALSRFPVLVGITRQAELHDMHLKLGYHYVGEVPKLLDGQSARVYAMTKESRADVKTLSYGRVRYLMRMEKTVGNGLHNANE